MQCEREREKDTHTGRARDRERERQREREKRERARTPACVRESERERQRETARETERASERHRWMAMQDRHAAPCRLMETTLALTGVCVRACGRACVCQLTLALTGRVAVGITTGRRGSDDEDEG